jgi:hypothetical protein
VEFVVAFVVAAAADNEDDALVAIVLVVVTAAADNEDDALVAIVLVVVTAAAVVDALPAARADDDDDEDDDNDENVFIDRLRMCGNPALTAKNNVGLVVALVTYCGTPAKLYILYAEESRTFFTTSGACATVCRIDERSTTQRPIIIILNSRQVLKETDLKIQYLG